ncbi:CHAT domain-containing protein [Aquicoccus sp. SCR17]|nr:CHAT domain-containing protein [Carideicomes alvinocaridis]
MARRHAAAFLAVLLLMVPHPVVAKDLRELVGQARTLRDDAPEEARALYRRAVGMLNESPANARNLAFLWNEIAALELDLGRLDGAAEAAEEALEQADIAQAEGALGSAVRLTGARIAVATGGSADENELRHAAEMAREAGRPELLREALSLLGQSLLARGQFASAEAQFDAALAVGIPGSEKAKADLLFLKVKSLLARRLPEAAEAALSALPLRLAERQELEAQLLTGRIRQFQARSAEAETLLTQVAERTRGSAPMLHASALYNLAEIEFARGRFAEAEAANSRAEAAYRELLGRWHPVLGQTAHRAALILVKVGNAEAAQRPFARALEQFAHTLGTNHPYWLTTRLEQARALGQQGRHAEAIAIHREVLSSPSLTEGGEEVGALQVLAMAGLGLALFDAGADAEALDILRKVQRIRAEHDYSPVDAPPGLNALAMLELRAGNLSAARQAADRALHILLRMHSSATELLGEARRIRAEVALRAGKPGLARRLIGQNMAGAEARLIELSRLKSYTGDFAPVPLRGQVAQALDFHSPSAAAGDTPALAAMFHAIQLLQLNETARATNGILQRQADPETAALLKRYRDATTALRELEARALEQGVPARLAARIADARAAQRAADAALRRAAPGFADRLTPRPRSVQEARSLLRPEEGLWLHAATDDYSYTMLLTADRLEVARREVGAAELDALVRRLRATLDIREREAFPPFDHAASATIFDALLGPYRAGLDKLKTLVMVPDAAAQQIAPGVLVRGEAQVGRTPAGADARFLGLTHALAVVPSVSSFVVLRATAPQRSGAGFSGFGDPILRGPAGGVPSLRGGIFDPFTGVARAGTVSRLFEPLPETADELRSMSDHLPLEQRQLYLGQDASEAVLKSLAPLRTGTLAFATHAVVSGDFDHVNEPALVMTPPRNPTRLDDGLLTTSEIAGLRLDADMVILSACNTASPSGRTGAPGLSGLASAFFEAGARSLVVSHWTILSASSVLLMPRFFGKVSEGGVLPGEAMRRAMEELQAKLTGTEFDHPGIWGPFTIVGAG